MLKLISKADRNTVIESSAYHEPKIAVWWYIDGEIVGDSEAYNYEGVGVTEYRGNVQLDIDHINLWEIITQKPQWSKYAGLPYETFSRGRVIFNTRTRKFYVIHGSQLVDNAEFQAKIKQTYNLPVATVFEVDVHYNLTADLEYTDSDRDEAADIMRRFGGQQ